MTRDVTFDERIHAWLLEEAPGQLPDRVLAGTFERTRRAPQRRSALARRNRPMVAPSIRLIAVGAAALVALIGILILTGGTPAPAPSQTTQVTPSAAAVASGPATSAKGQIAFDRSVDGNTDIYLVNVDGTGLERLTDDPAADTQARWSPDGKLLVFVRTAVPDTESDVYILDVATKVETRLTNLPGVEADPHISPDGSRIVYAHWPDQPGIYVMDVDGSGSRLVRAGTSDTEGLIEWGSDTTLFTFDGPSTINRVDVATGTLTTFLEGSVVKADGPAGLSPDGTRWAFKANKAPYGVIVTNLDGSNRQYVADGGRKGVVQWSSDGTHLLFSNGPGTGWYIVAVDGSELTAWPVDAGGAAWRPGD
jgi:Tol biopolymer transport system component